jgi:hypothetical protein
VIIFSDLQRFRYQEVELPNIRTKFVTNLTKHAEEVATIIQVQYIYIYIYIERNVNFVVFSALIIIIKPTRKYSLLVRGLEVN